MTVNIGPERRIGLPLWGRGYYTPCMATCEPSPFLASERGRLRELVSLLSKRFDYVSILGTDDEGVSYRATKGETVSTEPFFVQRGFVARAQAGGRIVEYSFNELGNPSPSALAERVGRRLEEALASAAGAEPYPPIADEAAVDDFRGSVGRDPLAQKPDEALGRLAACRDALLAYPDVAAAQARFDFMRVRRVFASPKRDLMQSFGWAQAYLFGVARRGEACASAYRADAGLKGLEAIDAVESEAGELGSELRDLLGAGKIEPGEYEVVLDPDVSGTLAHEAFGHGVETDMFVKRRARAAEYVGKRVASPIVNMFDGAAGVAQTGSFLFDDEGVLGTKTQVIRDGILLGGISDSLSAMRLGIPPTGNGRRQAYDRKAYARMTNTYFAPGSSNLGEMLAAIEHGWYLEQLDSGMEDPKNWGIELKVRIGREIRKGKFTGRVASPVVCSGYVPDVLSAIDMISGDLELRGSGMCGKGHKEYVKVSAGGPFIKTRMRLG
jgi:TldD protein